MVQVISDELLTYKHRSPPSHPYYYYIYYIKVNQIKD